MPGWPSPSKPADNSKRERGKQQNQGRRLRRCIIRSANGHESDLMRQQDLLKRQAVPRREVECGEISAAGKRAAVELHDGKNIAQFHTKPAVKGNVELAGQRQVAANDQAGKKAVFAELDV